jgi:IMP dehydrogenase
LEVKEGLTFDDVLLIPKRSPIISRSQTDLKTKLSRHISLNIPLISANMDTVTESNMAIAIAQEGGIGIIHRFMTIADQVDEILKVKRSESVIIEQPYTISPSKTANEASKVMQGLGVSGLLVMDDASKKLVGIITNRDIMFQYNTNNKVKDLMTKELVTAKQGISIDGGAVGVKGDYLDRTDQLLNAGTDIIVVDIAHGHSDNAINAVHMIKKAFPNCELIAGNVATGQGVKDLIKAGVDAVKIGVGSGSICITRVITGSGVPQLTAVVDGVKVANEHDVPVISDGGIRTSGDAIKALAAGASTVMIGSLFGGTDESPGKTIVRHGKKFKMYRGMASFYASLGRKYREEGSQVIDGEDPNDYVPEGVEAMVPYKGSVTDLIKQFVGGIRSGLSYCGAKNIAEMQRNAEFVKITPAGITESQPHDVDVM